MDGENYDSNRVHLIMMHAINTTEYHNYILEQSVKHILWFILSSEHIVVLSEKIAYRMKAGDKSVIVVKYETRQPIKTFHNLQHAMSAMLY